MPPFSCNTSMLHKQGHSITGLHLRDRMTGYHTSAANRAVKAMLGAASPAELQPLVVRYETAQHYICDACQQGDFSAADTQDCCHFHDVLRESKAKVQAWLEEAPKISLRCHVTCEADKAMEDGMISPGTGDRLAAPRKSGRSKTWNKHCAKRRPFDWNEEHPLTDTYKRDIELEVPQTLSVEAVKRMLVGQVASSWEEDRMFGFLSLQQSAEARSLRVELARHLAAPGDVKASMGAHVLRNEAQTLAEADMANSGSLSVVINRKAVDEKVDSVYGATRIGEQDRAHRLHEHCKIVKLLFGGPGSSTLAAFSAYQLETQEARQAVLKEYGYARWSAVL